MKEINDNIIELAEEDALLVYSLNCDDVMVVRRDAKSSTGLKITKTNQQDILNNVDELARLNGEIVDVVIDAEGKSVCATGFAVVSVITEENENGKTSLQASVSKMRVREDEAPELDK